ncbi:MAG TPA: hypothetical protein VG890_05330 [Puia sp.]|nr:hypothetical protein [Puia sp.]
MANNQYQGRRKIIFTSIVLGIILAFGLARFHYPKTQLAGNYYLVPSFVNNQGISFKAKDGSFLPIVNRSVKQATVRGSMLSFIQIHGDSSSYFIVDTRKDFKECKGENVLGPVSRALYLKFSTNPSQFIDSLAFFRHS